MIHYSTGSHGQVTCHYGLQSMILHQRQGEAERHGQVVVTAARKGVDGGRPSRWCRTRRSGSDDGLMDGATLVGAELIFLSPSPAAIL